MTREDFLCRSLRLIRSLLGEDGALLWDEKQRRFVVVQISDGKICERPQISISEPD